MSDSRATEANLTNFEVKALRDHLDRQAIDDVINGYYHALDTRDFSLLKNVFAEDAMFVAHTVDGSSYPFHGFDAVLTGLRGVEAFNISHHGVRNRSIAIDGDNAQGNIYALDALLFDRDGKPCLRFHGLRYVDTYARTAAGWRIASRHLYELWEYEVDDLKVLPEFPIPR